MSILSVDDYLAASRQLIPMHRLASKTSNTGGYFSVFELSANPGAPFTMAIGNTTTGVVPVDTDVGYPPINTFTGGATGYITRISATASGTTHLFLYDRLWAAGALDYTSGTTTFSSQPSYASRMPGGSYDGTEIWVEFVAAVGNATAFSVTVTYTNQSGTAGRSTTVNLGTSASLNLIQGRAWRLPLAAGDTGVQKIESCTIAHTLATVGTLNVMVMRPLWDFKISLVQYNEVFDLFRGGMPVVFDTSALYVLSAPDGGNTATFEMIVEIANK